MGEGTYIEICSSLIKLSDLNKKFYDLSIKLMRLKSLQENLIALKWAAI